MPLPIVIDTDPGQDDAVAILMALASPELEVLGLTTVAGNAPLPQVTANALRLLELAKRADVPVHAGCPRPMLVPLRTAQHIHGESGMNGAELPAPSTAPRPQHAVSFLIDRLRTAAEPVTLVPIGPLTNIALALIQAPDIVGKIGRIVLMGGAFRTGGNATPAAEFNILVDPHAAAVVFDSGVPIVMVPLDASYQAITTPARLAAIGAIATPVARAVHGMLGFYHREDIERFGVSGSPLHDPLTLAYLLAPSLFETRDVIVGVETHAGPGFGATVVDWWRRGPRPANVRFVHGVDAEGFFRLVGERLARF
jgi:purine nucleosidase